MFGTLFKKGAEARKELEGEAWPEKTVMEVRKKLEEEYIEAVKAAGFTPTPLGSAPPGGYTPLIHHLSTPVSGLFGTLSSVELIDKVCRFCLDNDLWIKRTGSQLVEGIEPNDYDYVVEDTEGVMKEWLERNDFHIGGSVLPESEFTSWKNGSVNVIVCNSRPYFQKYLMATELLKQLQPKTKEERVDIFNTVMGRTKDKYEVAF